MAIIPGLGEFLFVFWGFSPPALAGIMLTWEVQTSRLLRTSPRIVSVKTYSLD